MTIVMTGIWWLLVAMIVVSLGMIVMVVVTLYDATRHGTAKSYDKRRRQSAYRLLAVSVVAIGCFVYGLIHFPS